MLSLVARIRLVPKTERPSSWRTTVAYPSEDAFAIVRMVGEGRLIFTVRGSLRPWENRYVALIVAFFESCRSMPALAISLYGVDRLGELVNIEGAIAVIGAAGVPPSANV